MKGLKKETQPADTEEHFGHNEGSRKKKKKKMGSNGDDTPLQMPAQKKIRGRR